MLSRANYFSAAFIIFLLIYYLLKSLGISEETTEKVLIGYGVVVYIAWLWLKSVVRKMLEPEVLKLIKKHKDTLYKKYQSHCHLDSYGSHKFKQREFRKDVNYFIDNIIYQMIEKKIVLMAFTRSDFVKFIEQRVINLTEIGREQK